MKLGNAIIETACVSIYYAASALMADGILQMV